MAEGGGDKTADLGASVEEKSEDDIAGAEAPPINFLERFLEQLKFLHQGHSGQDGEEKPKPEQLLSEVSFQGIAEYIESQKCKNIIVLCGAGISTSAGIPDFRSPGSGLYDNLQKYNLPTPQSIFEISYFKEHPEAFFALAKELYPGVFKPTMSHYFVKLLERKGLLLRVYTQNIDTLERVADIDPEKIVEAHGTFHTAHCLECKAAYSQEWVRDIIFKDEIPKCINPDCEGGIVKPDIVFFGESLPVKFAMMRKEDFCKCDLLIIMGTSLKVQPFASLVDSVPDTTPRLLINREKAGAMDGDMPEWYAFLFGGGMNFDTEDNYRDVFWEGNCDDGCRALCTLLGWQDELKSLVENSHAKLEELKPNV